MKKKTTDDNCVINKTKRKQGMQIIVIMSMEK